MTSVDDKGDIEDEGSVAEIEDKQGNPVWPLVKRLLQIGLAILILYFVFTLFWTQETLDTLLGINVIYLILAIVVYAAALVVASVRLRMLIRLQQPVSFKSVFWANLYGMLMAEVTPGKTGYLLATLPLERAGVRKSVSLSTIGITQVMDFAQRGVIGVVAIIFFAFSSRPKK